LALSHGGKSLRADPVEQASRRLDEIPGVGPALATALVIEVCWRMNKWLYCRALISLNLDSACSNLPLKSHIASRISRKVADVLTLSPRPKAKTLLFRRYPMILGSEIL
jgi:hypothetical protein